jgi:signal transduction histidine kinase
MILYFLALGIGSIVITGLFSFNSARRALMERSYNQLTSIRLTRKAAIERFFTDRLTETAFLARSGGGLEQLAVPDYYSGCLPSADAARLVIETESQNAASPSKGQNPKGPDKPFILDYRNEQDTNKQLLSVCRINGTSEVLALVIRQDLIDSMMLEVSPSHGLGHSGETYLVGPDYLMRTSSRFISNSMMNTRVATAPAELALKGHEGIILAEDYRGIKVLSSYGRIDVPGLNWLILAEIDYMEATASINVIRNNIIMLSLLTALALFILTYTISKRITRPLVRLTKAAADLGSGTMDAPLPVESQDETGELTEAFNQMRVSLRLKDEALKAERINRVKSAIDGQDQERQRLSRELHDGIGQGIIGVRLRLAALEKDVPEKIRESLRSVIEINDNLIDEVRTASNALMPPALAEFGLLPAVRSIGHNISDAYGIDTRVEGEFPSGLFGRKPVLYIFRIIQEAMNNAAKHSGAEMILVSLEVTNEMLTIKITDNGKGFDTDTACNGHGLLNMKERVSLLKGCISMASSPSGTTVTIEIPVNKLLYDKIISG